MKILINHVLLLPLLLFGQSAIDNATATHLEKIIDMRHQIHQNPNWATVNSKRLNWLQIIYGASVLIK